ncbi:MAG: antibiotic biosynthesis monooxygenase [Candidatus Eremiobacteraeota bacterium]|nr:antibiotic biosynthesis monooxygenase [Candidatus Eremiobacteraeota bacterium]
MVHVVAFITALPGKRDALLAAFHDNVPAVRAEEGCVEYSAVIDAEGFGRMQTALGPDAFVVIEKWATPEALKAHARAPHMAAYAEKAKDLIAARAIHVLSAA